MCACFLFSEAAYVASSSLSLSLSLSLSIHRKRIRQDCLLVKIHAWRAFLYPPPLFPGSCDVARKMRTKRERERERERERVEPESTLGHI